MNQQRLQSYIDLIQQLLACPSGEEWILLRQNESLVTPELVQVMEQVATQLANQGNVKESKFLHNLAGQIHHLFMAPPVSQATDDADQTQAYIGLIEALLACPAGAEAELFAANQHLIGPGLVQTMQQVAKQVAANGDRETAQYLQQWAEKVAHLWLQPHKLEAIAKPEPASEPQYPTSAPVPSRHMPVHDPGSGESAFGRSPPISAPTISAPTIAAPTIAAPTVSPVTESMPFAPMAQQSDGGSYQDMTAYLAAIAAALTQLSKTLSRIVAMSFCEPRS